MDNIQDLSFGKTCQEHSPVIKEKISKQSSNPYAQSKKIPFLFLCLKSGQEQDILWEMDSILPGEQSMLSIGEYPKEEDVSILSQILQVGVPEKYYLSQKACQGILRRADARGKELAPLLKVALMKQAQST